MAIKIKYQILGMFQEESEELIDETDKYTEVDRLLRTYKAAFGQGWKIWSKVVKE